MRGADVVGYIAIVLIQASTLPAFIQTVQGLASIPPMTPALLALGMGLLLWHSLKTKATVYIVSNSVGVCFNLALLGVSL